MKETKKDIFENDALLEYRYLYHNQNKTYLKNNTKNVSVTVKLNVAIYNTNYDSSDVFQFTIPLTWLLNYMNEYYLEDNNNKKWSTGKLIDWVIGEYTSEDSENIFCNAVMQNVVMSYEEL